MKFVLRPLKDSPQGFYLLLAGFAVPESTTALVAEVAGVGKEHPLSIEKLSTVLAYYVVDG